MTQSEQPLERFYWIEVNRLAGSSRPGGPRNDRLPDDLRELQRHGIGAIVSLTETPLDEDAVLGMNMTYAHIPMIDMAAPTPQQLLSALAAIDSAHAAGHAVLVHCLAGQGRTGVVLAAWRIRQGMTTDNAIGDIRLVCDHAVENETQIACLRVFEMSPMSSVQCPEFPPMS